VEAICFLCGMKKLFEDFPPVSTGQWEEQIRTDLGVTDYGPRLIRDTGEGIRVRPFYREEDLEGLGYLESVSSLKQEGDAPNSWLICQDITPGDPARNNERITAALQGGAQAIRIRLGDAPSVGKDYLQRTFSSISLDGIDLLFKGFLGADALYDHLLDLVSSGAIRTAYLKGLLGADPLGKMAVTGIPLVVTENLGKLVRRAKENTPGLRVIDVNGALFQEAGSTLVQELAFSLSMANEYLAILTDQGIDAILAAGSLQLSLASGPDYFMEIAKLRAARILWNTLCAGYGMEPGSQRICIHSTTSGWNMTLYDPYVNMLRETTEAMSAILGGADLVTVLPFDHPCLDNTAFSDRIARSVQIILRDEVYLERVADPAAGSYYIESLTDTIAEKAWDLFQQAEVKGGFRKAFQSGWIQEQVLKSIKEKTDLAASGKKHIVGTNAFPNFNEVNADRVKQDEKEVPENVQLVALRPFRIASVFEELRLETERSGKRPVVYLFKFGDPAWVTSRARFAGNFFAVAGYQILDSPVWDALENGLRDVLEAGPDILVLCSSDDTYPALAPPVLSALKDRTIVAIAGDPADHSDSLIKAGIEHFINVNSHLLETLRAFNRILLNH
jgi:methylmalonyl-CoA mutase